VSGQPSRPNRLAGETSPYLLQHADNPVDWYPWGEEAFARARSEARPVLLSVGYAACHWCHVMAHESFEDPQTARLMNESFVCVKVDREERPDIDEIYMAVVQAMTGHGGWPMTVFLTPEGQPFFGGTYFPPEDRYGMPGFPAVLRNLARAYAEKRADVLRGAGNWTEQVQRLASVPQPHPGGSVGHDLVDVAVERMSRYFDPIYGGFGGAPKFPHSMDLSLFMRVHSRTGDPELLSRVRTSLDRMAAGGIYDQLAGGFHRYAVDERWAVPHFEKMLYDNALLARTYLEAYQLTGEAEYARIGRETLDWMLSEMADPAGGFWSSQDADSEGEEGRYYVWDPGQVRQALGAADAEVFCRCHGVTDQGNFEGGKTVLYRAMTAAEYAEARGADAAATAEVLARGRSRLLDARRHRVAPATDDKVLACWNGLAISALATGASVLGERRYRDAASAAAEFVLRKMFDSRGRLLRTYRAGRAKLGAYLEDHGALCCSFLDLYEATFETRWVLKARELCSVMLEQFWDEEEGGFYFTARDHEKLLVRTKPYQDGATPSGTSLAVRSLVRLAGLTGDSSLAARARTTFDLIASVIDAAPSAFAHLLATLDRSAAAPVAVALVGTPGEPETEALIAAARRRFGPWRTVALLEAGRVGSDDEAAVPLLAGKRLVDGRPAAYVCRGFACQAPVTTAQALEDELARA
jgi:hypothetical protein